MKHRRTRRVDIQVSILTAVIVVLACTLVFGITYSTTYSSMIEGLKQRVMNIYTYLNDRLDSSTFTELNTVEDEAKPTYIQTKELLHKAKDLTGVIYLYTAKEDAQGNYIYLVDGLPSDSADFRHIGDRIEPEIIPDIQKALAGQAIMPNTIKNTSWGYIFISYMPVYNDGQVSGVVGIEFDAGQQYNTFRMLRIATPIVIVLACLAAAAIAVVLFRRISNPSYKDMANTDLLTGLKNRNAFDTDLTNLTRQLEKHRFALLSVDLDHLKQVNDTLGHAAGDQYIKAGCDALVQCVDKRGVIYRIGGDEFAVYFRDVPDKTVEGIMAELARFSQKAAGAPIGPENPSLSFGYAVFERADQNLFGTLRRADRAMYEQKGNKQRKRDE